MTALKNKRIQTSDSKMEDETRRFNKRAFIGSFIIHLFFLMIKLPQLELKHKLKDDPKLIPISMTILSPTKKTPEKVEPVVEQLPLKKEVIKEITESSKEVKRAEQPPVDKGTDRAIKKSDRVGDKFQKKIQDTQKGDPASLKKEAYRPGTELQKTKRNSVGTGAAPSNTMAKDNNSGGSGDTYQGFDMTNVTDSIRKSGQGLKRAAAKGAVDDGGAGTGSGSGIGSGQGGGKGDGFITGSTSGTPNAAKVATNIGSLTGAAKGTIDSSRGFDGLAQKGSVMVAGVPVERIAVSTIDPDAIRRILREHIPQFRSCYQKELDTNKKPEGVQGRMTFKFKIGGGGRVISSDILSDEISSNDVRECIKDVLNGIQFPKPGGDKIVEVSQPINFYPKRIQ